MISMMTALLVLAFILLFLDIAAPLLLMLGLVILAIADRRHQLADQGRDNIQFCSASSAVLHTIHLYLHISGVFDFGSL